MTNFINIDTNNDGIPFLARVVKPGDAYGRHDCLINHSKEDLIEFYDARYPMEGKPGQFVSRYYRSTLEDPCEWRTAPATEIGVNLDFGIDDWTVTAAQVQKALA